VVKGIHAMETIKPTKIHTRNTHVVHEKLTSAEMGKLWVTYYGNSMSQWVLKYYLKHVEDPDIKKILEYALQLCETILKDIKSIYMKENFPIPYGFTEEDVNFGAPRLFADEFYYHYLRYVCKAGLSVYSIAVSVVTRPDIRDFFINVINSTIKLITDVNNTSLEKGFMMKPPTIPTPEKVDFVKKQNYLTGFLGHVRPLHAIEITHLHSNIDNNVTSKALLIGFSQVAKNEQLRQLFIRGKEITNKHIEICTQHLNKDNLPAPTLVDHLVSTSSIAPFSDKLMLAHKIDMFSMKIRSYAEGLSLNGRHDIGVMYARFEKDVGLFVEDAANIMIDHGWMEQMPEAPDRDHLASK
jgi:hypothetical protein